MKDNDRLFPKELDTILDELDERLKAAKPEKNHPGPCMTSPGLGFCDRWWSGVQCKLDIRLWERELTDEEPDDDVDLLDLFNGGEGDNGGPISPENKPWPISDEGLQGRNRCRVLPELKLSSGPRLSKSPASDAQRWLIEQRTPGVKPTVWIDDHDGPDTYPTKPRDRRRGGVVQRSPRRTAVDVALADAEDRVRRYMRNHFSESTIRGVVEALRG